MLLWLGERPVDVAYSGMHKQAVVNPFGMYGCVYITTQLSIYAGGEFSMENTVTYRCGFGNW